MYKKMAYKKDKSIELEFFGYKHQLDPTAGDCDDKLNGWVRVKKDGKTLGMCLNFEAARQYIYKFLIGEKEIVREDDFEDV